MLCFKKNIYCAFIFIVFLLSGILKAQTYVPGEKYLDNTGFVEYHAGNLPFVLSIPHGGYLTPDSIPDRECPGCVYTRDAYTQEIGRLLCERFYELTGCYPHLIINLLDRKKFDANRDLEEAANGNIYVEKAWFGYHAFIDSAKLSIVNDYTKGLFLDIHGHGHDIQRIELGYLLKKTELQLDEEILDSQFYINKSSIRSLVLNNNNSLSLSDLLHEESSFGALIESKGFKAVPGPFELFPNSGEPYFSGGYNMLRHGSSNGGTIDAIQLELNQDIRFNEEKRLKFVDSLTRAIIEFYNLNYNNEFDGHFCEIIDETRPPLKLSLISVYPNPVDDYILIKSKEDLQVQLFDVFGRLVYKSQSNGNALYVKNLNKGIYFLIMNNKQKYQKPVKIIKK